MKASNLMPVGVGLAVGAALGTAMGNLAIGVAIGVALWLSMTGAAGRGRSSEEERVSR